MPQMENAYPAGVMRVGYLALASAMVIPPRGMELERKFTAINTKVAAKKAHLLKILYVNAVLIYLKYTKLTSNWVQRFHLYCFIPS